MAGPVKKSLREVTVVSVALEAHEIPVQVTMATEDAGGIIQQALALHFTLQELGERRPGFFTEFPELRGNSHNLSELFRGSGVLAAFEDGEREDREESENQES